MEIPNEIDNATLNNMAHQLSLTACAMAGESPASTPILALLGATLNISRALGIPDDKLSEAITTFAEQNPRKEH